jgi:hypothetical protein
METRTHRDAAAVVFPRTLLITNFLFPRDAEALVMCVALARNHLTVVGFSAPQRARVLEPQSAAMLLAHAAPAAPAVSVVPTGQGPMWGLPQDAQQAVTGLND